MKVIWHVCFSYISPTIGYPKLGLCISFDHRGMTFKPLVPTAPSCIDNSWRSTTLESVVETYLMNSEFGVGSCPFHPRFIYYIYLSSNETKLEHHRIVFQCKNDFKSKRNHDSTAFYHKHPVCQYPGGEDTVKLTSVWWRVLGMNRIIGTWYWSLGGYVA